MDLQPPLIAALDICLLINIPMQKNNRWHVHETDDNYMIKYDFYSSLHLLATKSLSQTLQATLK